MRHEQGRDKKRRGDSHRQQDVNRAGHHVRMFALRRTWEVR